MCGLVGMAGDIGFKHRDVFKQLLILDAVRGFHSTGVMAVTPTGEPSIFKKALLPHDLFDMGGYARTVTHDAIVLMGHNRYATQGSINSTNAHPFQHGKITGAHNGTLTGKFHLPDHTKFNVDSDNLVYAIDKLGTTEALALTCGAFALSLYNEEDRTLQLVRNAERPLYYAWTEDRKVMMWASEPWMLRVAPSRVGVDMCKKVNEIKKLNLYTFDIPKNKIVQLGSPTTKKVEEYTPPKRVTHTPTPKIITTPSVSVAGIKAGDMINYYAIETDKTAGGGVYVHGMDVLPPYTDVRTYAQTPMAKKMLSWRGECRAEVMAVVPRAWNQVLGKHSSAYIIVNPNSLKYVPDSWVELPDDKPSEEDVNTDDIPGHTHTRAKFDSLTRYGCVACGCNLYYDKDDTVFDNDAPFCEECWAGYDANGNISILGGA